MASAPHTANANLAAYFAVLDPGDTVLGMRLDQGGHLTHGSPVNFSGLLYHAIHYGVGDDGRIDYAQMQKIAREQKPKMIIAGASAFHSDSVARMKSVWGASRATNRSSRRMARRI